MLQLLSCLSEFIDEMKFVLFEGFYDLIEFLIVWLGELVEHSADYLDWFLSDDIDYMLIVLIFIEEEGLEFIEDDDPVLLIGQTHLLYLLFTKHIFKEIAFAVHATLSLFEQGLLPHLHSYRGDTKLII
jgi:hypothetical protein